MQLFFELYTHYLDACLYVLVPGMQLLTAGWAAVFVDLQTQLAYVKKVHSQRLGLYGYFVCI